MIQLEKLCDHSAEKALIGYWIMDMQQGIQPSIDPDCFYTHGLALMATAMSEGKNPSFPSVAKAYKVDPILPNECLQESEIQGGRDYCLSIVIALYSRRKRAVELLKQLHDCIDITQDHSQIPSLNATESMSGPEMVRQYKMMPKRESFGIGLYEFDNRLEGVYEGQMVVIGGRSGVGKTSVGLWIAMQHSRGGGKSLFVSTEMGISQLVDRMREMEANNDGKAGSMLAIDDLEKSLSIGSISFTTSTRVSIEDLRRMFADAKKNGCNVVFIDHLQRLVCKADSRREEVSKLARGIKSLAVEYDMLVFLLSQLKRKDGDEGNEEPTTSDLKESGDVEAEADSVWLFWRPHRESGWEHKAIFVKDAKSRNSQNKGISVLARCGFDLRHIDENYQQEAINADHECKAKYRKKY